MKQSLQDRSSYIYRFLAFILMVYWCFGCSTGVKDITHKADVAPVKSAALFDYFTYIGLDDVYDNNPLTGNDQFYNPILPGWYSDPSICTNGEDYFLVTSTFAYFPGVPIFHSRDLVNWRQIGNVLDRPVQLPLYDQRVNEGIFAPTISYNPHNKTYYMVTTNGRRGVFYVKTKDPFGSWSDPVWMPGVKGVDPSFFFDDNGKVYLLNNEEPEGGSKYDGHRSIRIQEFDIENNVTYGPKKKIVNGGANLSEKPIWVEAPHLYKINGSYFLICAEGGSSSVKSEVVFKASSPMGEFVPWANNPMLTQDSSESGKIIPISGVGRADLVQTKEGEWWSVFMGRRMIGNQFENLGRETYILPVRWSDDGFPYITYGEEIIPTIVKREGTSRADKVTFGNFEVTDEFDNDQFDPQWMTLRGPALEVQSLTANPGYVTLRCADVNTSERKIPAFVTRRIQHHKFECNTKMIFKPHEPTEAAGLLLFKDERHQYFFSVKGDESQTRISVEKISETGVEVLASKVVKSNSKYYKLKVVSDANYLIFFFACDDDNWTRLIGQVETYYLSTANSFGFTGTTIGMYATSKPF